MKAFTLLSVIVGVITWYLSQNGFGFPLGVCLFWCGAAAAEVCGVNEKVKTNSTVR